jgi:hypothetical protein
MEKAKALQVSLAEEMARKEKELEIEARLLAEKAAK